MFISLGVYNVLQATDDLDWTKIKSHYPSIIPPVQVI